MKIEMVNGMIVVNGVSIYDLTDEARDNLRKRVASYLRTHRPGHKVDLDCAVRGVVRGYGEYVGDDIVLKI
jgi:hypothetical protein